MVSFPTGMVIVFQINGNPATYQQVKTVVSALLGQIPIYPKRLC